MDCSPKHVENHLKTLRSTWNTVQTLLNKSGLGWDDNLKMTTCRRILVMISSSTRRLICLKKCLLSVGMIELGVIVLSHLKI
uniref:Putative ovule protein n=1 Tax=Solanum chacoense TaxID=4108 RepID=A0A0V0HHK7_SOLCH